jgi:hypothetical protein
MGWLYITMFMVVTVPLACASIRTSCGFKCHSLTARFIDGYLDGWYNLAGAYGADNSLWFASRTS